MQGNEKDRAGRDTGTLFGSSPLRSITHKGRLHKGENIAPILSDNDVEIAAEFMQRKQRQKNRPTENRQD